MLTARHANDDENEKWIYVLKWYMRWQWSGGGDACMFECEIDLNQRKAIYKQIGWHKNAMTWSTKRT